MSPIFQKQSPRKGIYLLPNLFTTAGLFAGFFAIVSAMKGQFDAAAIAIFVAMIMDTLDGRLARLTHTESAFGAQYDSLTDMVAFGMAPALIVYSWALNTLGKLGWLVAFMYAAAAALRLARFNTQIGQVDKRFFIGLATTPSAGVIAGYVWFLQDWGVTTDLSIVAAVLTALLALLMVSNIRYHSFKNIDLKGHVPFVALLVVVMIFVAISVAPPTILFIIFLGYALSGPVNVLRKRGLRGFWKRYRKNSV